MRFLVIVLIIFGIFSCSSSLDESDAGGYNLQNIDALEIDSYGPWSMGGDHTCVRIESGVQCWGEGWEGQLGNGKIGYSNIRVDVVGLPPVSSISVGAAHTCAVTLSSEVYCWGKGGGGQLGNNSYDSSPIPTLVSGLSGVKSVSAGENHTCAVLSDKSVKCWGNNLYGQLGDGTTVNSKVPVNFTGINDASEVYSSYQYTCILKGNKEHHCAGNIPTSSSNPMLTQLAAGSFHICAINTNNEAYCGGSNWSGELGDGTTNDSQGAWVKVLDNATYISAGTEHTCAIMTNGSVKCWGKGWEGQLGDGSSGINSSSPVTVLGIDNAKELALGRAHSCALLDSGSIKCWGQGGSLGIGDVWENQPKPLYVLGFGEN
jgi:alpha-tubulin suppressor-like RCC1 family protein